MVIEPLLSPFVAAALPPQTMSMHVTYTAVGAASGDVNSAGCARVLLLLLLVCGQAASGNGGGISASVAGDRELTARDTTFSNNSAVSGGAVFLSGPTNGVAVGHFLCDTCTLKDNSALSKVRQISPSIVGAPTAAFSCTCFDVHHLSASAATDSRWLLSLGSVL